MSEETSENSPVDRTATLQNVIDNVERFLVAQVDRLEQGMADVVSLQQCHDVGDISLLLSQFEVTKGDWQRKCESQRVELEEDCQRLAEAWEQVENEQRQMLAARSIQQTVRGSDPIVYGDASADLRNKTPTSLTPVMGTARKSAAPRDPASLTFKQLQQQIRTHNKRRK